MVKRSLPKYVSRFGKYLYFRRPDKTLHRMPDDPASVEFSREYARLRSGHEGTHAKRTVKALIAKYKQQPKWDRLAANTKKSYLRSFVYFEEKIGTLDPVKLKPSHILDMQHALADTPTTANRRLAALSVLMQYAVRIEWATRNPCFRIDHLKSSKPKRKPWPQDMIEAARKTADPDTLLLFEMLLGTAQRISDVLAMQWSHITPDGIAVVQSKTDTRLVIPLTTRLAATLAQTPRRGLYIVTLPDGRPMGYNSAWKRLHDLRTAIGAEAYDNHALRYAAAAEIASLPGMTLEHVQAITGHETAQMARLYSYQSHQLARAREAQKNRK